MTNAKLTKRALISSAVALILCFSMLLGTTYAWFTDSVTSAGNIIQSGKLDVTMEWADGKVDPATANWTDASTGAIFNYKNWEPGYAEVRHIKIANAGTLALKYQLNILANGEVSKLADVIDVYYVDPAIAVADRSALVDSYKIGTLTEVLAAISTTASGNLAAGDSVTITLALKMQETAGNEYQNLSIGTDFAIQLLATQLTAEKDSFGNDYDVLAPFGTYIELDAGDDLLAAMASAQPEMPLTIKLNGDVEWPTEGHHGENDITPASSILIDGNGNTITATGSGVTPIGDKEAPMTLKNVKIVDNSVSYNESAWEFTYLEMGGTKLNCYDVTFADEIQIGTDATFTNCSFESNEENVYAVWVEDGSAVFTNCAFTGYRGLKAHEDYGTEISSVVVKGCTFENITKKPGIALGDLNADTTVSITDSTFINCQAGDQTLYIYETDTDVNTIKFTNENNNVYNNATVVSTKEDLLALSAKAFTDNNGKAEEAIIIIGSDIDMDGADFSAIIAQRGDKLTIVGNGHKISNINVVSGANDNTTGQASMFYAYPNSTLTVSNLTIENITVTADADGTGYAAAIVGYCEGKAILDNVDVVNATVTGVKSSGMLVGHLSGELEATNCDLSGTVTLANFEANGHYAGKYIGTLAGAATLDNCTANVTVSGNLNTANIGEVYGRKTAAGSSNLESAKTQESLNNAIANGAETVLLASGTYTFPASSIKAGTTIICDEGTVFDGKTGLNINGATVVGATFTNDNDYLVNSTTINGTFKDCVFTDCDGLRYCYAGENVVFENCVFDTDFYGVHFDGGANDVVFKNCTFSGFNTFGGEITKLTLEDCTFKYNGKGGYCGINLWGNSELINCTFVFDGTATEWVDLCNSNQTVTFTNCVVTDGTNEKAIETVVGNYGDNNTIIIDGVTVNIPNMN